MDSFIVFEVRAWFLIVLVVVVVAALAVGGWLLWRWLAKSRAEAVEVARREAEETAMQRRNRMLIRLDHELKNPLTALRTSAATARGALEDGDVGGAGVEPALRQIDSSARRVARLLADLRRLADVETRSISFQRVDMDQLIHQAVEDARTAPGAEDRMIVATVARAPWKLPDVAGDEDLLLSAVLNLLANALKYSSDTDTVELRGNEQIIDRHRWVVVEVADTGSGIPVDEQTRVWDELQRGSKVRAVAGSGMGLSLVRAIIERHGGTVELFSQEGVGTSVRLVLPVLGDAPQTDQGGAHVPGADMAHVAAGSRPVQPFQEQGRRGAVAGGPRFLPPREPSHDEQRFMGTPRRGSKRRIQTIGGELVDTSTGESLGSNGTPAAGTGPADGAGSAGPGGAGPGGAGPGGAGPGGAGPVGAQLPDSGPYRKFKPPQARARSGQAAPTQPPQQPQPPQGSGPPQAGAPQTEAPQAAPSQAGPSPSGVPQTGPTPSGVPQQPQDSAPQPQSPQQPPHGSGPPHAGPSPSGAPQSPQDSTLPSPASQPRPPQGSGPPQAGASQVGPSPSGAPQQPQESSPPQAGPSQAGPPSSGAPQ